MNLPITFPNSLSVPIDEVAAFGAFLQQITNRRAQGYARYGVIARRHWSMNIHGGYRPNSGRKIKCLCGCHSCKICSHPRSAYRRRNPWPWPSRAVAAIRKKHGWS